MILGHFERFLGENFLRIFVITSESKVKSLWYSGKVR